MRWDSGFIAHDLPRLIRYTGIKVFVFKPTMQYCMMGNNNDADALPIDPRCFPGTFSWNHLLMEIVKDIKVMFAMKWWTYKAFKKAYDKGGCVCPKCHYDNFDID